MRVRRVADLLSMCVGCVHFASCWERCFVDLLDEWMCDEFAGCVREWREISLVGLLPLLNVETLPLYIGVRLV